MPLTTVLRLALLLLVAAPGGCDLSWPWNSKGRPSVASSDIVRARDLALPFHFDAALRTGTRGER